MLLAGLRLAEGHLTGREHHEFDAVQIEVRRLQRAEDAVVTVAALARVGPAMARPARSMGSWRGAR